LNHHPSDESTLTPDHAGRPKAAEPATPVWSSVPAGHPTLIEGRFTHDSLPDLFRFVCSRSERLSWELETLAGTFTLYFEQGTPLDIMFRPVRMTGAQAGPKAFRKLFMQEGGRFRLYADPPAQPRRSLDESGESLMMKFATQEDEAVVPPVRFAVEADLNAALALVEDLPPPDHRTAFRAELGSVSFLDVLQLFSVSRQDHWIQVLDGTRLIGRVHLNADRNVVRVEYGKLQGQDAFSGLLAHRGSGVIDVRSVSTYDLPPAGTVPLGMLDALLMRELLAGRLGQAEAASVQAHPGALSGPGLPGSRVVGTGGKSDVAQRPGQHPTERGASLQDRVRALLSRRRN